MPPFGDMQLPQGGDMGTPPDGFGGGQMGEPPMGMPPEGMGGPGGHSKPEIRNIALTEVTEWEKAEARTETLVFEGITHEYYQACDFLAAEKPRSYLLDFTRYCYWPKNCYKYAKLPGRSTVAAAKRIVLVDAPKSFDDVLPDFLLRDIVAAVKDGAELIVLDGPFTLDRGEFAGTPLEAILPEGALHGTCFPPQTAKPEILTRAVEKGTVKVFRGLALGADPNAFKARFAPWAEKLFK